MITAQDIGEAIAALNGNASDKTPKPSEVTIRAWKRFFDDKPRWTGDDLAAAVWEYCKRPRERIVQPADLGDIIATFYRDRLDRMNPDDRQSAWDEIGYGAPQADDAPRDRYGFIDKSVIDEPPYPPDWTTDQRLRATWERVRSGVIRPGRVKAEQTIPAGYGNAPDEHEPGEECRDPDCDKPSTFGPYCARHYVTSFAVVKEMLR